MPSEQASTAKMTEARARHQQAQAQMAIKFDNMHRMEKALRLAEAEYEAACMECYFASIALLPEQGEAPC
jgi:hypothetical protein